MPRHMLDLSPTVTIWRRTVANLPSLTALHVSDNIASYVFSPKAEPPTRHARLFRNGANQAVRIPKEFEFPSGEVTLRKVGNTLVIEPIVTRPAKGTLAALALVLQEMAAEGLGPIEEEFPNVDEGLLPLDDIDFGSD